MFCSIIFNFLCVSQQLRSKKPPVSSNGVPVKGRAPSNQPKKVESAGGVKRTASSEFPHWLLAFSFGAVCLRLTEPLPQQMLALGVY